MLIAKVDKIIELRKARGLNQKKLSEKAGLPVNAVFRIDAHPRFEGQGNRKRFRVQS